MTRGGLLQQIVHEALIRLAATRGPGADDPRRFAIVADPPGVRHRDYSAIRKHSDQQATRLELRVLEVRAIKGVRVAKGS